LLQVINTKPRFAFRSWHFARDTESVAALSTTDADVIVIDIEDHNGNFRSLADIRAMQQEGRRKVYAYINIGVAQDWRSYWKPQWADKPPKWLYRYSSFEGGHPVAFWTKDWADIVHGLLQRATKVGYNGVYFGGVGLYSLHLRAHPLAGTDMSRFVQHLAGYIEGRAGDHDFDIIAENPGELVYDEKLRSVITGVAQTGLLFNEKGERIIASNFSRTRALLTLAQSYRLPVFASERVPDAVAQEEATRELQRMGFIPYVEIRGT
jgi:uncharacterized protein (TIGR01370 family)